MLHVSALAGDLLTLSFNFGDRPDADAFIQLIEALISLGARLVGTGEAHRGAGMRDRPFADILEVPLETVPLRDIEDLVRYRADPTIRVIKVYLEGATGTLPGVAEAVGYAPISPEAARVDRHALTIYTEGRALSRTSGARAKDAVVARELGAQLVERFQTLIEALHPSYAAIIDGLPFAFLACPTDLRDAPRTFAFRTFFVSRTAVGHNGLARLEQLCTHAYIETLADGLYVSTRAAFNPAGTSLDTGDATALSDAVADLIAGHA